jgi:hypothetical protein
MKMVACNANHHNAAKSDITDNAQRPNYGFLVKDDVPCHLAYHAGLDAVDGQ